MATEEKQLVNKITKEINIKDYLTVIWKRLWIIVIITLITSFAGYSFSNYNNTLLYETSTRIVIGSDNGYMNTLMVIIKDPIIIEGVKEELELDRSAEAIANQVEVTRIDDSQVIKISVTDRDPELGASIANAIAKSYQAEVVSILNFKDVQLLSAAKVNDSPINAKNNRLLILSILLGVIIGIGMAFLLDSLDSTVNKEYEVEEILGVPVIGVVSNMNKKKYSNRAIKMIESVLRGGANGGK